MKAALWMLTAWTLGVIAMVLLSDGVTVTLQSYITNGPY